MHALGSSVREFGMSERASTHPFVLSVHPFGLSLSKPLAALLAASICAAAIAAPEATSPDGRWRVLGQPGQVLVLDRGVPAKTLPARSLQGREQAQLRDVHYLPARRSFVIAFDDTLRELWELSVDPDAPPLHDGLVHDWRMGEAIASPGFLGVRRTPLDAPVRALAVDSAGGPYVLARSAEGWLLVHLDVRRVIGRYGGGLARE
jgi:hypothetical protein